MSITIKAKTDYSNLFSNLNTNSTSDLSSLIGDYASIKNGSYSKLMKAYYAKDSDTSTSSVSTAQDSTKTLAAIEEDTEALEESANKLIKTGTGSVFNKTDITTTDEAGNETTSKGYDTDKIYSAVSDFVSDYNSLITWAADSKSATVSNRYDSMTSITDSNAKLLSKLGITINKDDTLSIDEKTFKAADMASVKSLFNGTGSYTYQVETAASMMKYAAATEAGKSNTYDASGSYSQNYSTGDIMDSLY